MRHHISYDHIFKGAVQTTKKNHEQLKKHIAKTNEGHTAERLTKRSTRHVLPVHSFKIFTLSTWLIMLKCFSFKSY